MTIFRLIIGCILSLLIFGCEDTQKDKKPVDSESQKEKSLTEKDSGTTNTENKKTAEQKNKKEFPGLTNETAVDFFTQYGEENPETKVAIETDEGTIVVQLYKDTPLHRANFIYMVKSGYLNTTVFHRVVENYIVQGGNSDRMETVKMRRKIGKYTLPPEIKHPHKRTALAAAKEYRDNPDDRSSPYEFYVVQSQKGAPHLDKNYTVFGKVVSGMEVIDALAKLKTDGSEWPLHNINITASIVD